MRRLLLVFVIAAALSACGGAHSSRAIVVTSYPVQYVVRQIAGASADVHNLARPGVEPHDLELTSDDIDAIDDARFVFYIGGGFQPAIAKASRRRGDRAVDVAAGLLARKSDPHFWLDPTLMGKAAQKVAAALDKPASAFLQRLAQLDAEYRVLATCPRKEFVTTHASFGYLATHYGLTELSISGGSPDAEPSPKQLADLSAKIRRDGIPTVFYEPHVPRAAAQTLAKDAGVTATLLDPLETTDGDYFAVMRRNLTALKGALGC